MNKDIRYLILKEYSSNSTSDDGKGGANKFLAGLKTHIGTYDLGTVRRALIELIDNDLLAMSNKDKEESIEWLKEEIVTTRKFSEDYNFLNSDIIKSSERLLRDLDNPIKPEWSKKIPTIRIYTTINGISFLKEWKRHKKEGKFLKLSVKDIKNSITHYNNRWLWVLIPAFITMIFTAAGTLGLAYLMGWLNIPE